jgi:hypothetical protein
MNKALFFLLTLIVSTSLYAQSGDLATCKGDMKETIDNKSPSTSPIQITLKISGQQQMQANVAGSWGCSGDGDLCTKFSLNERADTFVSEKKTEDSNFKYDISLVLYGHTGRLLTKSVISQVKPAEGEWKTKRYESDLLCK